MKTWLLDANTLVYAMNRLGGVRERANAAALDGRLLTSAIVVSELLYGAERSSRVEVNRREVHATSPISPSFPSTSPPQSTSPASVLTSKQPARGARALIS